ncbi:MAG: trypsin-like peptidase domain-containing protein [Planctomycetota bacterium]
MEARAAGVIVCALLSLAAFAQAPIALRPDRSFQGELDHADHPRQDFIVEVPKGSVFLDLKAVAKNGDVELFGGRGKAPEDLVDAELYPTEDPNLDELIADRLSDPEIEAGRWWFAASLAEDDRLGSAGNHSRCEYSLELTLLGTRTDAILLPGPARRFTLDPVSGGFRTFRIDVPEGSPALRIDLHGVPADLDLFAHRGSPTIALEIADASARHGWGAESLVLTQDAEPLLGAGEWYIDVLDAMSSRARTPFDIRVAFDAAAPPEWSKPPVFITRDPVKPLSRALCSVLEVFAPGGGGSATLVTPDGLCLTNAHVVDRGDRHPLDEIVLAANVDSHRPAEEAFRGSVVRFDAALDLALIQIDRGFYSNPLPAGYRFPTVELAAGTALEIGDPLWIIGYPTLGGTGSRVSIHCAHGVLSGFDQEDAGLVFKTDAAVIPGNSGGAAVDEQGRLIGVPSANVSDGSGLVGIVTPITLLPPEWMALIASRTR